MSKPTFKPSQFSIDVTEFETWVAKHPDESSIQGVIYACDEAYSFVSKYMKPALKNPLSSECEFLGIALTEFARVSELLSQYAASLLRQHKRNEAMHEANPKMEEAKYLKP